MSQTTAQCWRIFPITTFSIPVAYKEQNSERISRRICILFTEIMAGVVNYAKKTQESNYGLYVTCGNK